MAKLQRPVVMDKLPSSVWTPTNFWKLIFSLTTKYKELSNKKLENNDAWRLASL
jgi:hypothetical protein